MLNAYLSCDVMWYSIGSQNFHQTLDVAEDIESNFENAKVPRNNDPIIYYRFKFIKGSLKEFLKLFECSTSINIHKIHGEFDLIFNAFHQQKEKKKIEFPQISHVYLELWLFFLYFYAFDI